MVYNCDEADIQITCIDYIGTHTQTPVYNAK